MVTVATRDKSTGVINYHLGLLYYQLPLFTQLKCTKSHLFNGRYISA